MLWVLGIGVLLLTAGCATAPEPGAGGVPSLRVPPTLPPLLTPAPLVSVTAAPEAFRRVSPAALAADLAANRVVLLDVRLPEDYAVRRIPGAQLFPPAAVAGRLDTLPHDRPLIVYCG